MDRAATSPVHSALDAGVGSHLGRFVVGEELGRGAMGVVVSAHDPDLHRTVAIKILLPELLGHLGAKNAGERLLREAQAMAQVDHANVVRVHEVEATNGHILIVMEHIKGRSLRAWLKERPRSTREIVDAFGQAGKGLAQVHRVGLVHRDFKPDNVLVGEDGRVCVTDFGLVGSQPEREPEGERGALVRTGPEKLQHDDALAETQGVDQPLMTRTGAFLGTPAYMAPEQHARKRADARADQFAFCVSLHEALCGERPFEGSSYEELRANVMAGRARPRDDRAAPGWLRRIVLRGLSLDPGDRYPSMDALVSDLTRDRNLWRRRAGWAALAVGLLGLASWTAMREVSRPGARLCQAGPERLAGVWDEPRKAAVKKAFLETKRPYAEETYERVAKLLDARMSDWVTMYRDSCEATHERGEQSIQMLDARTVCLERRRTELATLASLFAKGPDVDVLNRAAEAAYVLPAVSACASSESLLGAIPLPSDPTKVTQIAHVRSELSRALALQKAGRIGEALGVVEPLGERTAGIDYTPALAERLALLGSLQKDGGDFQKAEATLNAAALEASRAKNDALLAGIWTDAIEVIGIRHERYAEALALETTAIGAVDRAGGAPLLRGRLLVNIAQVWNKKGDVARALRIAQEAVGALEQAITPSDTDLAQALTIEGNIYFAQQKLAEAEARYTRALEIRERLFGGGHRSVAAALNNMSMVQAAKGDPEKAIAPSQRAVDMVQQVLGPDHPYVADVLVNYSLILTDLGRYEEALAAHRKILAIREKTLSAEHPQIAEALGNIGYTLVVQDRFAEAVPYYERAVDLLKKSRGEDHSSVAVMLSSLGDARCRAGDPAHADKELRQAVALVTKLGNKDDPAMALDLAALGECLRIQKRSADARAALEQALVIARARKEDMDASQLAEIELNLAELLWELPAERKRAREMGTTARDRYKEAGGRYGPQVKRAEVWLGSRR